MDNIKEKVNKYFKDKKLYLFGIITFLFFGIFVLTQYAPDTYFVFTSGAKNTLSHFFSCGRFVTGIAAAFVIGVLKLENNYIYFLSYICAIIFTVISLYKLYNLLQKDIKNELVCIILSTLVIINPFSFELFVYIEKSILMFSVLMCILAVEQINEFLINKNKKNILFSLIYMLIASCSYQGTIGIFVAISLIYIIKYSKTIKDFVYNNIIVALVYGLPAIVNFIIMKFTYYNSRIEGNIIISESIRKIVNGTIKLFIDTYNLLPKYMFIICIAAILLFIIYKTIINKNLKSKSFKILGSIYILIGVVSVAIVPQLLQSTASIWFVARSSYPIASIIGILLIYIFINFDLKNIERSIIIILAIIFLFIQLTSFIKYGIDGYIVNYEDKQNTMKIISKITEYEEQTGNIITKIAFYQDKNPNYTYQNIKSSGDINIKALYPTWSAKDIINFYSKRKLEIVESNIEIKQIFSQEQWDNYSQEQMIFEKDTIHLCLY